MLSSGSFGRAMDEVSICSTTFSADPLSMPRSPTKKGNATYYAPSLKEAAWRRKEERASEENARAEAEALELQRRQTQRIIDQDLAEAARLVAEEAERRRLIEEAQRAIEEERARLAAEEERERKEEEDRLAALHAPALAEQQRRAAAEAERIQNEEAKRAALQARREAQAAARRQKEEEARLFAEAQARLDAEAAALRRDELRRNKVVHDKTVSRLLASKNSGPRLARLGNSPARTRRGEPARGLPRQLTNEIALAAPQSPRTTDRQVSPETMVFSPQASARRDFSPRRLGMEGGTDMASGVLRGGAAAPGGAPTRMYSAPAVRVYGGVRQ